MTKRDGVDMQQFLGVSQSLDSLVTIVGPALAAMLIGFGGDINALWVTAALSCAAALVTVTLPRSVGAVPRSEQAAPASLRGIVRETRVSLSEGVRILFKNDAVLRASTLLSFGIVMVLGSFQGLVLPVHFTESGHPELLGYVLSSMSFGLLAGSLGYAALAPRLRKRTWYILSLAGMAAGVGVMASLPSYPVMLAGATLLGITAGPASALLGFFAYDRIPAERRGSALGTQNALLLVAAPVAVFATSVGVSEAGTGATALALFAVWGLVTACALVAPGMRSIDDAVAPGTLEDGPAAAFGDGPAEAIEMPVQAKEAKEARARL